MRLLACGAALGLLLACGHYGPPVRSAEEPAAGNSEVIAPGTCEEDEEKEQGPRP